MPRFDEFSGYALTTLPDLMQPVHTRMRLLALLIFALTVCRFTFQRRRVTLCAWEMLLPNCGFLPQSSQTCAMTFILFYRCSWEIEGLRDWTQRSVSNKQS